VAIKNIKKKLGKAYQGQLGRLVGLLRDASVFTFGEVEEMWKIDDKFFLEEKYFLFQL
jgi:hypothetical protein